MYDFHSWADAQPERPVLTLADSGVQHSAGALAQRSRALAQWLAAARGLQAHETIAILMENRAEILELALAAQLGGLYFTVISTHLTAPEVDYILRDSGARHVFVSQATAAQLGGADLAARGVGCHAVDSVPGLPLLADALAAHQGSAPVDLSQRPVGRDLLYSSGTTGQPKGIRRALEPASTRQEGNAAVLGGMFGTLMGFGADTVYLSPAPLYHAAPLRYCLATLAMGGALVVMPRFDAAQALALIERWRVTHSQWVPTMFSRLLQLPEDVRQRHDLSSHRCAIHAAAPCPVPLKQAMLDWWGDILVEYYAGSEACGITFINAQQWRSHPGSVGAAISGQIHILDDEGKELPSGQIGHVYFSDVQPFEYLNAPEKTRQAINERGWATYGDLGHVDADGYLYLSDRRADLILSGGVNLYPQEIENALAQHAAVQEVAVVGVPDADFGEQAVACVVLNPGYVASEQTALDIAAQTAGQLARIKRVQRIRFVEELPRLPTGKLLRRVLKEQLRAQPGAGFSVRAAV